MTIAVCIECGAMKHGAFNPCPACEYEPIDNEAKAHSMMLTDHFMPPSDLERVSERIRDGHEVRYEQETVDAYVRFLEENPDFERQTRRRFLVYLGVIVSMVLGVLVAAVYLLIR